MFNPGRLGLNGAPGCGGSTGVTPVTVCRGAELYQPPVGVDTAPETPKMRSGACLVALLPETTAVGARRSTLTYVEKVRPQFLSLRQLRCSRLFSARGCWQLSPVLAVISDLSSGSLIGRARPFFSEWLNSLQSSGLRGFGTVFEIRVFELLMNSDEMGFCKSSRAGKSIRFRIRHIEVRILPPQPGSHSTGDSGPVNLISARQLGLFVGLRRVSRLPIWTISERNRR